MVTASPDTLAGPPSFYGLSRQMLAARLAEQGLPSYRADQVFSWVYRKHHRSAERMANLPASLRLSLRK